LSAPLGDWLHADHANQAHFLSSGGTKLDTHQHQHHLQRDGDLQSHRAERVRYQRNGSLGSSVRARGALSIKGELKMASNPFTDVISEVQKSPQNQRTEKLIDGIAQQMQQSGNAQAQQLGQELQSAKSQLVRACQQQGG
jgi:hypothetical protein